MKQQKTETWLELWHECAALKERINRKIDAECAAMNCPGVPLSSLRLDYTHGSSDLMAVVEWQASRVVN